VNEDDGREGGVCGMWRTFAKINSIFAVAAGDVRYEFTQRKSTTMVRVDILGAFVCLYSTEIIKVKGV
jgi:hypothetical protein